MGGEVERGGNGQTSRPVVEKVGPSWNKMQKCKLMMGWGGYGHLSGPLCNALVRRYNTCVRPGRAIGPVQIFLWLSRAKQAEVSKLPAHPT